MRPARDSGSDSDQIRSISPAFLLNTLDIVVFSNFNDSQIVRIGSDDLVQRVDLLNHRRLRFFIKVTSRFAPRAFYIGRYDPPIIAFRSYSFRSDL
jgi:hypothetical protein